MHFPNAESDSKLQCATDELNCALVIAYATRPKTAIIYSISYVW